jgi:hypothetical protein
MLRRWSNPYQERAAPAESCSIAKVARTRSRHAAKRHSIDPRPALAGCDACGMSADAPVDRSVQMDAGRAGELRLRRATQVLDVLDELAVEARGRPKLALILAALPFDPGSPGITLSALALRTRSSEWAVTAALEWAASRQLVLTCRSEGVPKHRLSGLGWRVRELFEPGRWEDLVRLVRELAVQARDRGWSPERLGEELRQLPRLKAVGAQVLLDWSVQSGASTEPSEE